MDVVFFEHVFPYKNISPTSEKINIIQITIIFPMIKISLNVKQVSIMILIPMITMFPTLHHYLNYQQMTMSLAKKHKPQIMNT